MIYSPFGHFALLVYNPKKLDRHDSISLVAGYILGSWSDCGFAVLIGVSSGAFAIDVLLCQKHFIRKTHHATFTSWKILSFLDPEYNRDFMDLQTDIFCQNHHA